MSKLMYSAKRAAGSLFHGDLFGLLILSVLLTIVVLAGFVVGAGFFSSWVAGQFVGSSFSDWIPWLGTMGAFFIALILFPGITPVIVSFFDQRISRLIEGHYYPNAPTPATTPFLPEFLHDLKFVLKAILYNILAIPLYFIPPVNLVIFYLLNGYLLGQEYFLMVARRHMPVADAKKIYRANRWTVISGGAILTLLTTIPVVNLVAPFWGVALMVHLYHQLIGTQERKASDFEAKNTTIIEHQP